jgi:NAD(P)H-dependent FMN reductase
MKKMLLSLCVSVLQPLLATCGEVKVLAFAGSTRDDSFNKKLIQEVAGIARQMGAKVTVLDLKDFSMPFYNADDEVNLGMPESAKRLREHMRQADVIFIATPEYNASVPALVKNTLDWASRSEKGGSAKGDVFKDKKFVLMSASPSKRGGQRALAHLDFILRDIGATDVSAAISISEAHLYFANEKRGENLAEKDAIQKVVEKSPTN